MTATTGNITHRKVAVPSNLERRAFLFMRLSGALLLILAVGHMLIQHVLNSSQNLSLQFVALQWNTWVWKVYDMFLLFFAVTHGVNGLRNVLEDYIQNRTVVTWINRFLVVFVIATVIWAGIAIALFDPSPILDAAQSTQ